MQSLNYRLGSALFGYVVDLFCTEEVTAVLEKYQQDAPPPKLVYAADEYDTPIVLVYMLDQDYNFHIELDNGGRMRCVAENWEYSGACAETFFPAPDDDSLEEGFTSWLDLHLSGF